MTAVLVALVVLVGMLVALVAAFAVSRMPVPDEQVEGA